MNPLYERFPDYVEVEGSRYRIVTDFREWIKMSELISDNDIPSQKKAELLLGWYIDLPDNLEEAIYKLGDFLSAHALEPYEDVSDSGHKKEEPVFSYSEDAGCIFSAFLNCYGIDLETIPYMHWWKFRLLFEGLPEETEIKQRMMYRNTDLNSIKDKDERKRVREIKKRIALHKKKTPVSDFDIGDIFA